jgi:hypothetical protein
VGERCYVTSLKPVSDPAWRAEVLTQALLFATAILPGFAALAGGPVQGLTGLQRMPGPADPDIDVAVGSAHMYQVAHPDDDARTRIAAYAQLVFVITCGHK